MIVRESDCCAGTNREIPGMIVKAVSYTHLDVYKRQGLGLKEAKDAVDGAPKVIKEQADKASAEDAKAKLEAEGAKVTLK